MIQIDFAAGVVGKSRVREAIFRQGGSSSALQIALGNTSWSWKERGMLLTGSKGLSTILGNAVRTVNP